MQGISKSHSENVLFDTSSFSETFISATDGKQGFSKKFKYREAKEVLLTDARSVARVPKNPLVLRAADRSPRLRRASVDCDFFANLSRASDRNNRQNWRVPQLLRFSGMEELSATLSHGFGQLK